MNANGNGDHFGESLGPDVGPEGLVFRVETRDGTPVRSVKTAGFEVQDLCQIEALDRGGHNRITAFAPKELAEAVKIALETTGPLFEQGFRCAIGPAPCLRVRAVLLVDLPCNSKQEAES